MNKQNPTIPETSSSPKGSRLASNTTRPQVLAVGPWQQQEFRLATAQIETREAWQTLANINQACETLEAAEVPPELVLLAQPLPGSYHQKHIGQLQVLVPLTRIVVVSGSWCEGGMRTGIKLTGVLRLYWHEFGPWWTLAQKSFEAGLCPPWSVPLDGPQAGRVAPNLNPASHPLDFPVAICAADYSVYETLAAALTAYDLNTAWTPPTQKIGPDQKFSAGIWDGGQLSPQELVSLTNFSRQLQLHNAPVVALLDYPRVEHVEQIQKAGAAMVLGKPYVVDELVDFFCQAAACRL